MKHTRLISLLILLPALVAGRTLLVLADTDCVAVGLDANVVPFSFAYDPEDILLPLFPGDLTRWELPQTQWTRPASLACDPDGDAIASIVCAYWTCPVKPTVAYDPNAGTWSPTITPDDGVDLAVFRATDTDGAFADYTLVWRGVNRAPVLH